MRYWKADHSHLPWWENKPGFSSIYFGAVSSISFRKVLYKEETTSKFQLDKNYVEFGVVIFSPTQSALMSQTLPLPPYPPKTHTEPVLG